MIYNACIVLACINLHVSYLCPPPPTHKWTVETCAQNVIMLHMFFFCFFLLLLFFFLFLFLFLFFLTITCTETSKMVQPISLEVAKQYLEEYYHNLDLWLAQKTQKLRHRGKKKRAVSFNQADLQHSKWDQGSDHSSSAEHGPQSLRGPHRRMSVDVRLLQMNHNSTALEKEPSCAEEAKPKLPSRKLTVTT